MDQNVYKKYDEPACKHDEINFSSGDLTYNNIFLESRSQRMNFTMSYEITKHIFDGLNSHIKSKNFYEKLKEINNLEEFKNFLSSLEINVLSQFNKYITNYEFNRVSGNYDVRYKSLFDNIERNGIIIYRDFENYFSTEMITYIRNCFSFLDIGGDEYDRPIGEGRFVCFTTYEIKNRNFIEIVLLSKLVNKVVSGINETDLFVVSIRFVLVTPLPE